MEELLALIETLRESLQRQIDNLAGDVEEVNEQLEEINETLAGIQELLEAAEEEPEEEENELVGMFDMGDKIEIFDGATSLGTGSYVSWDGNRVVWADSAGHIRISSFSGDFNFRKI